MKIAVVTDSTAYLTKEELAEYGVYVLPMSVIFGQETYREEITFLIFLLKNFMRSKKFSSLSNKYTTSCRGNIRIIPRTCKRL